VGLLAVEVAGGLVACVASAVLWREVSAPGRERARQVAGTLAALEQTLGRLEEQVGMITEASRRTKRTLDELAVSLGEMRAEVDTMLLVADESLDTARGALDVLETVAGFLHGLADQTTWLPNRRDHDSFRASLYFDAALVRGTRGELDGQLREVRATVVGVRGPAGDSMAAVEGLLGVYAFELEVIEESVLPSLAPLLRATAGAVGGLAGTMDNAAGWIDLLCLALGGIGIGLKGSGLAGLVRGGRV
jgi:hypothetical protein